MENNKVIDIELSQTQEDGLVEMLSFLADPDKSIFVLRGSSGTGKTTLISHFIERLPGYCKMLRIGDPNFTEPSLHLTATTNQAAQVLQDKTGLETQTIHSLLGLRIRIDYKTGEERLTPTASAKAIQTVLEGTLILLDEGSMGGKELLKHLYKSMAPSTKLIIIGDPAQLPPVKERRSPAFFSNFPQYELQGVERQKKGSSILVFGDQIRKTIETGQFHPIIYNNKDMIHLLGPDFQKQIDQDFIDPGFSENNKILSWRNKRVMQYNNYVRSLYTNSPVPQKGEIYINNGVVTGADQSIILGNNVQIRIESAKESFYGDCQLPVYEVRPTNRTLPTLYMPQNIDQYEALLKHLAREAKQERNWRKYFKYKNSIADLRPGAALTVHKSQGSTFNNVYVDLGDIGKCGNWNEVARMLYVAVTRASNKVYFTGLLPEKYWSGKHESNY